MKASRIIAALQVAIKEYGDLPCYLADSDIASLEIRPTTDGGAEAFEDGKRVNVPNEFTLIFHHG